MQLTTEQRVSFDFSVTDGRGRPVAVDGTPAVNSSDATVATVTIEAGEGMAWKGMITAIAPGSCRIVVDADADLGAGVQDVIGTADIDVVLDERTGARLMQLNHARV